MKSAILIAAGATALGLASPALAQQHAADLVRESSENGIAFASKYQSGTMTIDDYVVASSATPMGVGSISVGAKPDGSGFPPSAQATCTLEDAQTMQKFGSLSKGAHIVLTGKFSSMAGSTIMMTDCSYRMSTAK